MKEPYDQRLATRTDPESCRGGGNIAAEALTGALRLASDSRKRIGASAHRRRDRAGIRTIFPAVIDSWGGDWTIPTGLVRRCYTHLRPHPACPDGE